jgi:hypothetical protein
MTDFLGRIAARAVGEAPLAQPRLPALFDPGPAGLDVVDTEMVVRAATADQANAADPPARRAMDVAESVVENTRRANTPDTVGRRDVPPLETGPRRVAPAPTMLGAEPAVTLAEPADDTSESAAPTPAADDVPRVAAVAVPATPTSREAVVNGAAAPVPATAAHDEPPPVRVHIGRLEVRANLQDSPPPPQPRPTDSRPQGLSLADYLRGKREAG